MIWGIWSYPNFRKHPNSLMARCLTMSILGQQTVIDSIGVYPLQFRRPSSQESLLTWVRLHLRIWPSLTLLYPRNVIWLVVWNIFHFSIYGNSNPNWHSYFSEGLKHRNHQPATVSQECYHFSEYSFWEPSLQGFSENWVPANLIKFRRKSDFQIFCWP